jgi:ribosomal protein L17
LRQALILSILVALVAAAAASAALTPTQYRAKLNAMCRGFTPKMKTQERAMTAAQKANNPQAYGQALGKLLVYTLQEDAKIESTAVPTAMRTQMTPIITTLKKADTHIRAAIQDAVNNDANGLATQLKAAFSVAKGLNAKLDAAGLRDCGSNQT